MFGYKTLLAIKAGKPHTFAGQKAGSPTYSKFTVHQNSADRRLVHVVWILRNE